MHCVELAIDTGRRPEEICELDFDCLTRDEDPADQREHVQQAVATVRGHRSVMLGMPRVRQALPDLRPEPTA